MCSLTVVAIKVSYVEDDNDGRSDDEDDEGDYGNYADNNDEGLL